MLFSRQVEEVVFRHEGGGVIRPTVNGPGPAERRGNGGFPKFRLGPFVLNG